MVISAPSTTDTCGEAAGRGDRGGTLGAHMCRAKIISTT
jgi:hypothetical protein